MALVSHGQMTKSEFLKHKKVCTVISNPHLQGKDRYKYGKPDPPFEVFKLTEKGIVFPRYYAKKNINSYNEESQGFEGIQLQFTGNLREYQTKGVQSILDSYKENNGAMLCFGCGLGKTVVATYMIHTMKMKTAVIVHKTFLMNQWKDRIEAFLPGARVGIVQGDTIDVNNKDVILIMLQTLSMKDIDASVFDGVGQLIVDECHHIAAKVFSRGMFKIPVKYTLGLSATPNRKDGLGYVLEWFLGPIVMSMDSIYQAQVLVRAYEFSDIDYGEEVYNRSNKICLPTMITNVTELDDRNIKIVTILSEILDSDETRKILLLSERRGHLKDLQQRLSAQNIEASLYIGGMKEDKLKEAEKARVILSTYSMTSEGFDCPSLNTLVLASSKTDIEQSVGRILRKEHEITPLIVDIIDKFSLFAVQGYQRKYYYKNRNYKVVPYDNLVERNARPSQSSVEPTRMKTYAFDDDE